MSEAETLTGIERQQDLISVTGVFIISQPSNLSLITGPIICLYESIYKTIIIESCTDINVQYSKISSVLVFGTLGLTRPP